MIDNKKIVVIIPARGGSNRLKRKNIYQIWGRPMIYWSINACKKSKYIDDIYVSTEDTEIKKISESYGAIIIDRPKELSEGHVFKQDVIVNALEQIKAEHDIVISLQPNSPEIKTLDLDNALEKFIKFDRDEIISVDEDLIQNAAFRIMKKDYAFQKSLSTKMGVYVTNCIDVHTIQDVKKIIKNNV